MFSLSEPWIASGDYFVCFFDDYGEEPAYVEVLEPVPEEPDFLQCKVHIENKPAEMYEVHFSRFVYKLSKNQFTTAWYSGFPKHPRRLQALVNLVKGGNA